MKTKQSVNEKNQLSLFITGDDAKSSHNAKKSTETQKGKKMGKHKISFPDVTSEEQRQEFFLPVSGFIWLFPEETEVVNHPMFQRLSYIYQLGQTYVTYRGATHKRIEHVLGTVHMVHRMITAVNYNYRKSIHKNVIVAAKINLQEERFIRLGALLHDIGHFAAGHTLEDELCLINKHDHDPRLDLIFKNTDPRWLDRYNRTLEKLIDLEYESYLPKDLKEKNITASSVARLLIRKLPVDNDTDEYNPIIDSYKNEQEVLQLCNSIRLSICRDMIGNTICADILDYLYRDWYHIGKPKTFDERILQYMKIVPSKEAVKSKNPSPAHSDKFVISIGDSPKIRTDAISSIIDLLESRYHFAESVLFHKTKIAASAMLDRALYDVFKESSVDEIEKEVMPLSDEQLISYCRNKADKDGLKISSSILMGLQKRELYTSLYISGFNELNDKVRKKIQSIYTYSGNDINKKQLAARNRNEALSLVEEDCNLPKGSLVMHCPSRQMNQKIAMVRIHVDDEIEEFCKYERENRNKLSGGHLDAQIDRFERLWKVHFFIKKDVLVSHPKLARIARECIAKLILGDLRDDESFYEAGESIVSRLIAMSDHPFHGSNIIPDKSSLEQAAHRKQKDIFQKYPTGAYRIKAYIVSDKDEK